MVSPRRNKSVGGRCHTENSATVIHSPPGGSVNQPASIPRASRLTASVVHVYGSMQKAWRCGGVNTTISRKTGEQASGTVNGPRTMARFDQAVWPSRRRWQCRENVIEFQVAQFAKMIEVACVSSSRVSPLGIFSLKHQNRFAGTCTCVASSAQNKGDSPTRTVTGHYPGCVSRLRDATCRRKRRTVNSIS
jgi:hypothetical protein